MARKQKLTHLDNLESIPKDRQEWLGVWGNQWGNRRFTREETSMSSEERAELAQALNPFAKKAGGN
jgi:hypothetical protein